MSRRDMSELETLPPRVHRPDLHPRVDPALLLRQDVDQQVELWWFGEPCVSLLCYSSSVALVLALGLAGVALLWWAGSATGVSAAWRLAVGSTLCLLALVVLLKQLLSSAVQDMGCVRDRRRILALRSGGSADPLLLLAAGLALVAGGAALLGLGRSDATPCGAALLSTGAAVVLSVAAYRAVVYVRGQRTGRRRRRRVRVYTVTGQRAQPWRDSASSQSGLI
ncbi:transmembrane protein 125 [Electrophorus electricus]|uniref:Transmembrane protein 125 n=1 Tax=Electrophorus electricus TaxID=8005 RepID=A0AAY5F6E1_ELEEL|nr:transmembrane protein 125 [Electrophorus electricus]